MNVAFALGLGWVLALGGCGMSATEYNARNASEIQRRAAFEMHCDPQGIKLTPLRDLRGAPGYVDQYGAEGCGKRLVYVHAPYGGWIVNTASEETPKTK